MVRRQHTLQGHFLAADFLQFRTLTWIAGIRQAVVRSLSLRPSLSYFHTPTVKIQMLRLSLAALLSAQELSLDLIV